MFELDKTNPDAENVQNKKLLVTNGPANLEQLNMTEQRSVNQKTGHPMVGSYYFKKKRLQTCTPISETGLMNQSWCFFWCNSHDGFPWDGPGIFTYIHGFRSFLFTVNVGESTGSSFPWESM